MKRKLVTVDAETLLATPMSKTMFIVDGLSRQNRQKLADVVAWIASVSRTTRLGNPDHALRCAVSLFGGYTKTN